MEVCAGCVTERINRDGARSGSRASQSETPQGLCSFTKSVRRVQNKVRTALTCLGTPGPASVHPFFCNVILTLVKILSSQELSNYCEDKSDFTLLMAGGGERLCMAPYETQ